MNPEPPNPSSLPLPTVHCPLSTVHSSTPSSLRRSVAPSLAAFTLVELLVAIGIIALLMGILFPVLSRARQSGYQARSQQTISSITAAIEQYHMEYRAYPGPIANRDLARPASAFNANTANVTGAENLVLGLQGGLQLSGGVVVYNAALIGKGPSGLGSVIAKGHSAYLENGPLSAGAFSDNGNNANDTVIPEFLDAYPDPLPILYMRANVGAGGIVTLNGNPQAQYDINQVLAYTGTAIGKGNHGLQSVTPSLTRISPPPGARVLATSPYDAYPFLESSSFADQPFGKDSYILISAGSDRVYGTADDITNFGGGK